jgi:regulator of RNase E activity RraB
LDVNIFNVDSDKLIAIADKHNVYYDGWGTYFIGEGALERDEIEDDINYDYYDDED